jgi:hypothetical protein
MPQRLSSYGLASAKDHTAIIYDGVPGVEGEGREPSNSNFGFAVDSRLLMEADFA